MKQHYKTLKIPETAAQEEIKKSFNQLSKIHHPDKGGDPEKQKAINEAYDVLSDPERRANYDEYGTDTKPKSIEDMANEEVFQAFKEIIKLDFQKETLFTLAQNSIKGVLKETEMSLSVTQVKVRRIEDEISELKERLEFIKSLLLNKVKPSMKILLKAVLGEIKYLESKIKEVELSKNNMINVTIANLKKEIKVHKKAIEILESGYPKESSEEDRPFKNGKMREFAKQYMTIPTYNTTWK